MEVMTIADYLTSLGGRYAPKERTRLMRLAFLHDVDKLERYEIDPEKPTAAQAKYAADLGIKLTPEDSKSTVSVKIDNCKNKLDAPLRYFRYRPGIPPADEAARVVRISAAHGLLLDDEDVHAISCHHGGWSDAGKRGSMSPVATLLHCADLMSANLYGKEPKE
jgi:hypothetical protein